MEDFEFVMPIKGQTRISTTFEVAGHPVTATTPEALILLQILAELRHLRNDIRSSQAANACNP